MTTADTPSDWLQGKTQILEHLYELEELAARCEQPSALNDLQFHWSEPNFGSKVPHVLLFRSALQVEAAVLLYEYVLLGVPTGIFLSPDAEGERDILAPADLREDYAWRAAAWILRIKPRRGRLLLLSLRDADFASRAARETEFPTRATVLRTFQHSLVLHDTLDSTLEQFGPRTRRNLRAAKRRALRQGIEFVPDARVTEEEFLTMVRSSAYAVQPEIAQWRYETATKQGLLAGLCGSDGKWLALLGGRRRQATTVVDWQVNLTDTPHLSLGLTMRAFLIEDEIARGHRELRFEGGTPHPMRSGFMLQSAGYVLLGSGWMTPWIVRNLMRRLLPTQSLFSTALPWEELQWHGERPNTHKDGELY